MPKKKIAYLDCFSGMSGHMTLGALVDAGVPLSRLRDELARLPVTGYQLSSRKVKRAGLRATKVNVKIDHSPQSTRHKHKAETRKWKDISKIIQDSSLSQQIKQKGLAIFKRLFEAEAKVHGGRYDTIHLHELGAIDCIVDIFGSLIGLDILGIDTVCASPLNLGSGSITSEHGLLPVPAPASVELLKGVPVYSSDISFELTTPTGAVLISSLASGFGPMPAMNISKTGTGAGDKNFKEQPNILRVLVGESAGAMKNEDSDITVVETNIDDMNPQVYDYVMERLFKAGALDVFMVQIIMKKNRPGIKLTVLTEIGKKDEMIDIILKETTSIGLRFYNAGRKILQREIKEKKTKYGPVKVKIASPGKEHRRVSAEYDDCKKIAKKLNIPLIEVLRTVAGGRS
jgi:uncharacterized protein (TIGR00299 family) protein